MLRCCKYMSYKDRLKYLHLSTLWCRQNRGDMLEVYKFFHNYDSNLVPILYRNLDTTLRGHSLKLKVEYCKIILLNTRFVLEYAVKVWNSLLDYVVASDTSNLFKANLDKFWVGEDLCYDFDLFFTGCGNWFCW